MSAGWANMACGWTGGYGLTLRYVLEMFALTEGL